MILRNILMYPLFVSVLVSTACDGDVFYEDGAQWHTINSVAGKNCFAAISDKAKWGVKLSNSGRYFLLRSNDAIEKAGNCKMKNYTFYMGVNVLRVYNGFGASQRGDFICVKNNLTNNYSATFYDDIDTINRLANQSRGNDCEAYETVMEAIERGIL